MLTNLAVAALIIAALYFGRELFVPVALAVLLSFALAPLVMRLHAWRVPRTPSVLIVVFCGWGVWAAAGRGTGTSPWPGLVLALLVTSFIFILARFLGYVVLERMWGRNRPHARWSHFLAGLFLTVAGVSYLINTRFMVDTWVRDLWDYLGEQWRRVV